jgi:transforming growth factor-beta-induced protein
MKTRNLKNWMWVFLLPVALLSFTACDENKEEMMDDMEMSNTITDIAVGDDNFSILVAALQKAGLADDLAAPTASFTVFAPTNAAFTSLLEELDVNSLDDIPTELLTSVLLYHVMGMSYSSSQLSTGYYSSLSAGPAEGYSLSFYLDMETTTINGRSSIIQADISADNGVVHVIDKVMLPMSITEHAIANPAFSSLTAAVVKAGLAEALKDQEAVYTVFAPVNAAFETFLSDLQVGLDDLTADDLSPIILYHALDGFIPAADVSSGYFGTLSTAFERNISVKVDAEGGVMLNGGSQVVATDVVATNGIIHAIDAVITPPTVVDVALQNSNFSILVEAVVKADLAEALSGDGPFTVFAPTNSAFEALFSALEVTGVADLTKEQLIPILLAHVVSANAASDGLSNGNVPTLNDTKTIAVNIDNGVVIDGSVNVILADVQASNGIVHVIDKVILP